MACEWKAIRAALIAVVVLGGATLGVVVSGMQRTMEQFWRGSEQSQAAVARADTGNGSAFSPLFQTFDEYERAQRSKTDAILASGHVGNWVGQDDIAFLARYMRDSLHLPFSNKFALCHGTRSGREQSWFMEALPEERVLGTELSPLAAGPNTVVLDFHIVKPEWLGKADFVYSNAIDHSYNATFAVQQWMKEVSPDGVLVLEWSILHTKSGLKGNVDIFGGSLRDFQDLIRNAGPFHVTTVVESPTRKHWQVHYIFAGHARQ